MKAITSEWKRQEQYNNSNTASMIEFILYIISVFSKKIPTETKEEFYRIIYNYYYERVGEKLPAELLEDLSQKVTDYFYKQYDRFKKQYPKSVKRYSSFQIKDLDHPATFELIINLLKQRDPLTYQYFACLMLNMTADKLNKFETDRKFFHDIF